MYRLITLFLVFFTANAYAVLTPPPIVANQDRQVQQYFQQLYDNHNVLNVTDTLPNGSRIGVVGELVIYNNGGTKELWTNTGEKTWVKL